MGEPAENSPAETKGDATRKFIHEELDHWVAAPMWALSLLFMILVAGGMQKLHSPQTLPFEEHIFAIGLLAIWPIFILELLVHALAGSAHWKANVRFALLPPLRLGGRDHPTWSEIWLPFAGWQKVDRQLENSLEKDLSGPMIGIALLVLPVVLIEFVWKDWLNHPDYFWRRFWLECANSFIWLAFAFELVLMLSITRRKLFYCFRHWIDILIVALPVVEVLPMLRLARLGRLGRVARAHSAMLTSSAQIYRARGMAMRAFRAFMFFKIVQKILQRKPERRLEVLQDQLHDHYLEIERIRGEMRELEERIHQQNSYEQSDS